MAFNPAAGTCSLIRVSLGYTTDWTLFDGMFTVQSLHFQFEAIQPFTKSASFHGTVYARMEIPKGGTAFDVGAQFPDNSVFAMLAPSNSLSVTSVLRAFHLDLPAGFPDIEISTLGFLLFPRSGGRAPTFDFQLAITKPFAIVGGVELDGFRFEIGAEVGPNQAVTGKGALYAAFTLGAGQHAIGLTLYGAYESSGLTLEGAIANVHVSDLIDRLATKFNFSPSDVPDPIRNILLKTAKATLSTSTDTATNKFTFLLDATTTIAGVDVEFQPTIALTYDTAKKKFSTDFTGTLTLTVPETKEILTFTVEFKTDPSDTSFKATYVDTGGKGLTFGAIASVFGLSLEGVPPDLDLDLTAAAFTYDTKNSVLAFGVQSKTYGTAAFTSLELSKVRQRFFVLNTNKSFSLSNLPLVGEALAKLENIQLGKFVAIVSSEPKVSTDDAKAINDAIAHLGTGYPSVPKQGFSGKVLLSAELDFGNEKLPLSVSLGGGSSDAAARALPATRALTGPLTGPSTAPRTIAMRKTRADGVGVWEAAGGSAGGGVTWFTIQKSFGPVTLSRIGAMYQSETQTLWFEIEGSLKLGPLTLSLAGLGIGSPLTTFEPRFTLGGLGLAYNSPPLTIAGGFVNLVPPGSPTFAFAGGLTIGTSKFTLTAFGYYGNTTGFPSLFIFGYLAAPIGGPPAFFVTGVALGFGYNSSLAIPEIDQIATFPFVQVLPGSTNSNTDLFGKNPTPLDVLEKILNPPSPPIWVMPKAGSLWFAAGITFTSFQLVNSQALVIVEVGDELVIALVGTARAQFPPATGMATPIYAYIELDLLVRFAPQEGVFSLQAVLAKSSFLLDKSCVLTGGFAFFVWFGENKHSGNFVLTLGGYNSGFTPPDYYPAVPIVGFHWSIDSSISIGGGVYFALTPAVLMAGGRFDATYQAGNLKAWFNAHADVIMRWKPFWLDAQIGITIGASYKIDLGLTTSTITAELGCDLELWGPPTGGFVSVDWYIISFTIPFGSSKTTAPTIHGWNDVQAMLPNTGTEAAPNVVKITPGAGLATDTTSPPGSGPRRVADDPAPPGPWIVRGSQFGFATSTSIPVTTATIGGSQAFHGSTFNVHPLQWTDVSATHVLTVTDSGGNDRSTSFQAAAVTNGVPASLWGSPPESKDGPQVPSGKDLLVPNQIVGVSLQVNAPQIGASAGAIDIFANLSSVDLGLPGANLPLNSSASPHGDIPVYSPNTVSVIADPNHGIAATTTVTAREAVYTSLGTLGYAPPFSNDPMTRFAAAAGCAFAEEPLFVS
jgi:hypothetical protein